MSRFGSAPTMARRMRLGQQTVWVVALRGEDTDAAMVRVASFVWAPRMVGRPERVGHRWQFVVRREERS